MSRDKPTHYELKETVIYREGVPIADFQGQDVVMRRGFEHYAGPAKKLMWQINGEPTCNDSKIYEQVPYNALNDRFPDFKGVIDPALGDKTPEFVRWLRLNYPAEAADRYKNRIVGV